MKQFLRTTTMLCLLMIAFSSCGETTENDASNLKWGHLPKLQGALIQLPPNSEINVCGLHSEITASYVKSWAQIIGRDKHLRINSSEECTVSPGGTNLIVGHKDSDPDSKLADCRPGDGAVAFTKKQKIVLCQSVGVMVGNIDFDQSLMNRILFHEVGHLWGLCDQNAGAVNCDPKNRSDYFSTNSLMGYELPVNLLTDDDITGITELSKRKDIWANSTWAEYLNNQTNPQMADNRW